MSIIEVVKYNGAPNIFAWKYPSEELGTWTQLIVNESQEAILFKGGKALDIFSCGRYTLDTYNIPVLNKIINLPFGGRSPFTAEVWYVNKLFKLDIKWGTASPIQIQDQKYGVFVPVRANGMFGIRIDDSKKFLTKLVGTAPGFDEQSIIKHFRGLYITKVKDALSSYVVKKGISVLEINVYIDELSSFMKERIEPEMSEYGIKLISFYVNEISIPEDDTAVKILKDALAKKAEMNIIGYSYQQERSFNTIESAAKNDSLGIAPFIGAGMGIGMGVGVGGAMAGAMSGITSQMSFDNESNVIECPKCHTKITQGQHFCGFCGYDVQKFVEEEKEIQKKMIKCAKCGALLPKRVKFCQECGTLVAKKCLSCGSIIEGNPKFCPECGNKFK